MKIFKIILLVIFLSGLFLSTVCNYQNNTYNVNSNVSIVQIFDGDNFMATGAVVGDGSYVVTVINYEHYSPGPLKVIIPGKVKYNATIQSFDPRTSATLLKISEKHSSTIKIGDSTLIETGQNIFLKQWIKNDSGEEQVKEVKLEVSNIISALQFNISWPKSNSQQYFDVASGGLVFNDHDYLIGIVGTTYGSISVPPGYISPVVTINSINDLVSGKTEQQSWAKGPVMLSVAQPNSISYNLVVPTNYDEVALGLEKIVNDFGDRLSSDEINPGYSIFTPDSGKILIALFASPIKLSNNNGVIIKEVKWIGVQSINNNYFEKLFYGTSPYHIEGGFQIKYVVPLPN